ncbi:MFS transporter [Ovoidimarina sediminis]|uniref:MFS transporter n=1 Tax=Ovoidimarina sediminis TaxID=3079856 RepID=UPI0039774EDB
MERVAQRRLFSWYLFDWASQPYNTLLLTFIFAPYLTDLIGSGAEAQAVWGLTVGLAGLVMAILSPVLGAVADASGRRMPWIWGFSGLYVVGSAGLWFAVPGAETLWPILGLFALGLIGMECATAFTNAMLPGLAPRAELGRVSGTGAAVGYAGGLVALLIALGFLAEGAETGVTLFGFAPAFGLDAAAREGTRFVGPFTAVWYGLFMVPFFLTIRDRAAGPRAPVDLVAGLRRVGATIRRLPRTPSLARFLAASMLYRDALSGLYVFGGIYAAGVMGWTIPEIGVFGIVAILASAVSAWLGGLADRRFGPMPVVAVSIAVLIAVSGALVLVSPDSLFGLPVAPGSRLPDVGFYLLGALIGAAGGALQAASRTLMVAQAPGARMTEAFGLYALAGKATSFVAPMSIAAVTALTGSQQLGILPVLGLLGLSLWLLKGVRTDGDAG